MSILDPKPVLPATLEEQLPERLSEGSLSATYGPAAQAVAAPMKAVYPDRSETGTSPALAKMYAGIAKRGNKPCRLIFTGSSTVAGANSTHRSKRFVNILETAFHNAFPSGILTETREKDNATVNGQSFDDYYTKRTQKTLPGIHVINAGFGGASASNYMTFFPIRDKIVALDPTLVVHMVGSNDYSAGINPTAYKASLLDNINYLKANIPSPHAHLLIHAFKRTDTVSPAYPWEAYRDAMKEIAAGDPENVAFVDLSEAGRLAGMYGTDPLDFGDTDGIHPTDAGHAYIAQTLRKALLIPDGAPDRWLLSDTFNRPDADTLGATETGQSWVNDGTANFGIRGGKAAPLAVGTVLTDVRRTDIDLSALLTVYEAIPGIIFRATDENTRMGFFFDVAGGNVLLYRKEAGALTTVAQSPVGTAVGREYSFRVIAVGDSITCYVDGNRLISYTVPPADLAIFTGTKVGIRVGAGTGLTRIDSFGVKAI